MWGVHDLLGSSANVGVACQVGGHSGRVGCSVQMGGGASCDPTPAHLLTAPPPPLPPVLCRNYIGIESAFFFFFFIAAWAVLSFRKFSSR
jgi:hypothetical protein